MSKGRPIAKREYTAAEFASRMGKDAEYVSKQCRLHSIGEAPLRPWMDGWEWYKKGKQWFFRQTDKAIIEDQASSLHELVKLTGLTEPDSNNQMVFKNIRAALAQNTLKAIDLSDFKAALTGLKQLEQNQLSLLTDTEIADLIALRWAREARIKGINDLLTEPDKLSWTPTGGLSDMAIDKSGFVSPLKDAVVLLDKIGEAARLAARRGEQVELTLTFKEDGTWESKASGAVISAAEKMFLEGLIDVPPDMALDTLPGTFLLYAYLRVFEIFMGEKANKIADNHQVLRNSKYRLAFQSRCRYCARSIADKRSQSRFCDDDCRISFHDKISSIAAGIKKRQDAADALFELDNEAKDALVELTRNLAKNL